MLFLLLLFIGLVFVFSRLKPQFIAKESITQDVQTNALYETRCGICHSGASPEAPRIEALKLLTPEAIVSTLQTGVMRNQASMLTTKQHEELAEFISSVEPGSATAVSKGMCYEDSLTKNDVSKTDISSWGFDVKNSRYLSTGIQIKTSNVSDLSLSWAFAFPNSSRARVQPTIAGNTLFTASQTGTVYALDRHTGCIRWTFQADAEIRSALVIDRDSTGQAKRLYFGDFNARVYAVDLESKKLIWKTKIDNHVDATITGTLSSFEDKLYVPVSSTEIGTAIDESYSCCSFRGSMVAVDKVSGTMVWKTYTIAEEPSQHGTTKENVPILAPSGAPIWTGVTIDEKRRCLYIGTGENYTRPSTKTSDAILAFSLDDGKLLWSQQTIEKDAWNGACVTLTSRANCPEESGPDADFGAPPILVTHDQQDLILAGQKSGHVYAMDPDNGGQIIWTSLVGRGGTMGGIHWGMAVDENRLYVPINDRGPYSYNKGKPKSPGLHALDIATGNNLWSTIEKNRCPPLTIRGCGPGLSAAITAIPGIVFGGTLDGYLKAYAAKDGEVLWSYDTKRDYEAVNGARAFGGSIDSDGPVVVENQVFINSGYAKFGAQEGNVLLAFEVE